METLEQAPWPPTYNLRFSKKAKHVHLKVFKHRGLEIVVPIRQQKRFVIADLLEEKRPWIEKHLATVQIKPISPITSITLLAINQIWQIEYKPTLSSQIRHRICYGETINTLTLSGNVDNVARTHLWLKSWLKQLAQQYLLPWLQDLSVQHAITYNKASIRGQQTLWGSCTMQKNISLNYKLLFVPPKYAAHVMLHELCHTKHLNHSRRFWDLLTKLDPDTNAHNIAIREGDKHVPSWLIE